MSKFVEVTKGVTAGSIVALNPVALISEEEKRELFGVNSKGAAKKDWSGFGKAKGAEGPAGGPVAKGSPGCGQGGRAGQAAKGKAKRKACKRRLRRFRSQVPENSRRRSRPHEDGQPRGTP